MLAKAKHMQSVKTSVRLSPWVNNMDTGASDVGVDTDFSEELSRSVELLSDLANKPEMKRRKMGEYIMQLRLLMNTQPRKKATICRLQSKWCE